MSTSTTLEAVVVVLIVQSTRARRSSAAEVLGIVPCQAKIEIKIPHTPIILHIVYVR